MAGRLTASPPRAAQRRRWWWALLLVVLMVHASVIFAVAQARMGWGAADAPPTRIQVAFDNDLAPTAPPAPAAPAAARHRRVKPQASVEAAPAASEAQDLPAEPTPEPPPDATDPAPAVAAASAPSNAPASAPALATAASQPSPVAVAAVASAATAASAPAAFEWPPSTRLQYAVEGNFRGPISGTASVEWLKQGSRYQVHLDLDLALVVTSRATSEGDITPEGLVPRRYFQETRFLGNKRVDAMRFEPGVVTMPDGSTRPALPGLQDASSQFVQLTWLFNHHPERLRVGQSIEIPLALPRSVDLWAFDVLGNEYVYGDYGQVEAMHLKPRRVSGKPPGNFMIEVWVAPTLQYLPVRLLMRTGGENYIDLTLKRLPKQAAP